MKDEKRTLRVKGVPKSFQGRENFNVNVLIINVFKILIFLKKSGGEGTQPEEMGWTEALGDKAPGEFSDWQESQVRGREMEPNRYIETLLCKALNHRLRL